MKRKLISSALIVLFVISLVLTFLKKDFQVINAEYDIKNINSYAPDCYIKFENKYFLTTNRWIYKWNILLKKIVPSGESILIYSFDIFENHYSFNEKGFRFLSLKERKNSVEYNNKIYKIDHKSGDSIFSKVTDNEIIIFINSKNLD